MSLFLPSPPSLVKQPAALSAGKGGTRLQCTDPDLACSAYGSRCQAAGLSRSAVEEKGSWNRRLVFDSAGFGAATVFSSAQQLQRA